MLQWLRGVEGGVSRLTPDVSCPRGSWEQSMCVCVTLCVSACVLVFVDIIRSYICTSMMHMYIFISMFVEKSLCMYVCLNTVCTHVIEICIFKGERFTLVMLRLLSLYIHHFLNAPAYARFSQVQSCLHILVSVCP